MHVFRQEPIPTVHLSLLRCSMLYNQGYAGCRLVLNLKLLWARIICPALRVEMFAQSDLSLDSEGQIPISR